MILYFVKTFKTYQKIEAAAANISHNICSKSKMAGLHPPFSSMPRHASLDYLFYLFGKDLPQ
jgi:hypothetical protein